MKSRERETDRQKWGKERSGEKGETKAASERERQRDGNERTQTGS